MTHQPQVLIQQEIKAARTCGEILSLATRSIQNLKGMLNLGRVRGTGPGVSFGAFVRVLEEAHPLTLRSPFEESDRVAGAVWMPETVLGSTPHDAAIAKLRWSAGADDLPMHVHDHSDRFIVVLEGRGFFHWSDRPCEAFDGSGVRTIAARDRDVFVFRRGLVHTFSTAEHAMTLLSVQCPFVPFDAAEQYRLPPVRWTRGAASTAAPPGIVCELHAPGMMLAVTQRDNHAAVGR